MVALRVNTNLKVNNYLSTERSWSVLFFSSTTSIWLSSDACISHIDGQFWKFLFIFLLNYNWAYKSVKANKKKNYVSCWGYLKIYLSKQKFLINPHISSTITLTIATIRAGALWVMWPGQLEFDLSDSRARAESKL